MNRRGFLKLLGLGAAATAAGVVLVEQEPVRRFWQVGRAAPVGPEGTGLLINAQHRQGDAFHEYMDALVRDAKESYNRRIESAMFNTPVMLNASHGMTYVSNPFALSIPLHIPHGIRSAVITNILP